MTNNMNFLKRHLLLTNFSKVNFQTIKVKYNNTKKENLYKYTNGSFYDRQVVIRFFLLSSSKSVPFHTFVTVT